MFSARQFSYIAKGRLPVILKPNIIEKDDINRRIAHIKQEIQILENESKKYSNKNNLIELKNKVFFIENYNNSEY